MKTFLKILLFFLLITQICIAQWVQTDFPYEERVNCLSVSGTNIYAGGGSVYLSSNSGSSWTTLFEHLYGQGIVSAIAASGTNIIANAVAIGGCGVSLSTNNGSSWAWVNFNLSNVCIGALAISGINIFAGGYGGMFLSTNNGTNWIKVRYDSSNAVVGAFAVSGTYIYAATSDGLSFSTNNGTNWTQVNNDLGNWVISLAVSSTNIFAGTGTGVLRQGGVYLSTNDGTNWIHKGLRYLNVYSLVVSGTNIFAGTDSGVYCSTNNGTNWTQLNDGLTNLLISALAIDETKIYAGTDSTGVWSRPLSELVDVTKEAKELPQKFTLSQNYPNPFNPATSMKYSIPKASLVSIKVYNILGKELETLVNEQKPAGTYELIWNASNLPSGVYFYRIQAGSFVETKKMILLK